MPTTLSREEDILQAAEDWQKAGHGVALATVVETGLGASAGWLQPCDQ